MIRRIKSSSPEETRGLAARLARRTRAGSIFCLIGPLGSGKTTFVQGFARARGFKGHAASPSFGIAREYHLPRAPIYHLDLFRLENRDLPNLGLEQYVLDPQAICLIEWPEIAARMLPQDRLEIRFLAKGSESKRTLALRSRGPQSKKLLQASLSSK